jgi:Uma2 family endonuclease
MDARRAKGVEATSETRRCAMRPGLAQRRFTAEEFHQMGGAGILDEDDRVELVDGRIIEMAAIGSHHAACVARLTRLMQQRGDEVIVWVQNPLRLDPHTELVPDVALLRPRDDFYAGAHPGPGDVLLLIEVADSTLEYDRQVKIPLYGGACVPEAWLVDLPHRRIEVFRCPAAGKGYEEIVEHGAGDAVGSDAIPGLILRAAEILG